ncbi:hypothetical protein CHLNCDRAFT_133478 [Chlorella variabilis]|uniref:FAD/NAD(P)-binding domain-containing protein n=1 Tax=Chlorella variabilis TaxID=554065 RepID=E1Z368_CHLVA|nr:hypothetical protein CHLNCDRAFT_133478 [Chlorella variabilis]EFN60120.1 hypothetical protein CHLNCDRAFT_133478 [Chlorella variabilis]|eukprot:XP_005852222.1 hypothetical protein CHLNCDRAFT_133478 [Chlorella variabilis]
MLLIPTCSFFEIVPCAAHALVSPASASKSLIDFPASSTWSQKQGLISGETLDFDYALLCTGSSYPSGVKPDMTKLQDRAITAAKTVVVVGGGSVGVEVASEVADAFPDKKVTIVASGDLLDRMAPSAQQYAEEWMKKHNVEVLTGERISDWGGLDDNMPAAATLKTSSGRTLAADLAFKCVGVTPATGTYAASLSSEQLGPRGAIEVYPTLQVKGWRNVFAAGDCNSIAEEKTAAMAGLSALAAAGNIIALDSGKELKPYFERIFGGVKPPVCGGTSLGSHEGVMQMGPLNVQIGKAPATVKGFITWMFGRIVGGSRFWGFLYRRMQNLMASGMAKEARRVAAAAATVSVAPASG